MIDAFSSGRMQVPVGSQTCPEAHSSIVAHDVPQSPLSTLHAKGVHPETSSHMPSSRALLFFSVFLQARHGLLHALSQQTPSTQWVDLH